MIGFNKTTVHVVVKDQAASITIYVCDKCGAAVLNHGTNAYVRIHKDWHKSLEVANDEVS